MSESQTQPESSSCGNDPEVRGLDISAMSANLVFADDGDVTVSVNITGTGTDVTTFDLYGASDTTAPRAQNGSHLQGPVASRPTRMSGSSPWTSGKSYTVEVTYSRSSTLTGWSYTVPWSWLSGSGPFTYNNLTLSKRTSP